MATAVEELVWAHLEGPEVAREMATEFFVRNWKAIRVSACVGCDDDVSGGMEGWDEALLCCLLGCFLSVGGVS